MGNLPNLFVVADGMGGHKAGDMASRYTVEVILESVRMDKEQNPIKVIRKAIEKANTKVLEKASQDANLAGMGTTVVVATVIGHYIYVANVGDSRLYLIRDKIEQITKRPFSCGRDGPHREKSTGNRPETTRIKKYYHKSNWGQKQDFHRLFLI